MIIKCTNINKDRIISSNNKAHLLLVIYIAIYIVRWSNLIVEVIVKVVIICSSLNCNNKVYNRSPCHLTSVRSRPQSYVTLVEESEKNCNFKHFPFVANLYMHFKARPRTMHTHNIYIYVIFPTESLDINCTPHVHLICILTAATYFIISVFLLLQHQNTRLCYITVYIFAYNVLYACYVCPGVVVVCAYNSRRSSFLARNISRYYCCCCALLDLRAL